MADARYVIDLILNARDNTQAAIASAIGNMEALQRVQERASEKAQEFGESFRRSALTAQEASEDMTTQQKRLRSATEEAVTAQKRLEDAASDYRKTVDKANVSDAQRELALRRVVQAERDLATALIGTAKAYDEQGNVVQKFRQRGAAAHAARIRELAEESERIRQRDTLLEQSANAAIAQERKVEAERRKNAAEEARRQAEHTRNRQQLFAMLDKTERDIEARRRTARAEDLADIKRIENERAAIAKRRAAEEAAAERELEAERKRIHDANMRRGRDRQRAEADLARSRAAIEREILRTAEQISKTSITPQDFDTFRRKLIDLRRDLISAGASGQESMRKINEALKTSNASLTEQRRLWLANARAQEAAAEKARELTARERDFQSVLRETVRLQQERERIAQARAAGQLVDRATEMKVDADISRAMAKLATLAGEIKSISGDQIDLRLELDTALARAELARFKRDADNTNSTLRILSGTVRSVGQAFQGSASGIAAFDNIIRGMMSLGITLFLNQIFQVAMALVGALTALASSAAMAGAALGGALTAGAAQAIPVVGVLATAVSRLAGVFKAVQQANLLAEQQSYRGANAARQQANATDAVRSAQEALADAHRRAAEAQRNINIARREARSELEDLILAEREADLAARGAVLSQEEAQRALRAAIRRGDTTSVGQRQLGVEQADLTADRARLRLGRTGAELRQRRAGGIAGSPEMARATEQLADANRAVRNAERGLERARRSATQAGAETSAAAGKLNYLLAGMTDAERRLFRGIQRLQDRWQSFASTAAEPLVTAFTFGVNRVSRILRDNRMIESARTLSSQLGGVFRGITRSFTSEGMLRDFRILGRQAGQNLAPLQSIVTRLARAFTNIAIAAGPSLNRILRWLREIIVGFERATARGRETGSLGRFFQEGVTHLQAWVRLIGAFGRLFLAIMGPGGGAKEGLGFVTDMTNGLRRMARAIEDPSSKANKFFRDLFAQSRRVIRELGPIFRAIAREIDLTFNKAGTGSIRGFANFFANVLIPALGKFMRFLGEVTSAVGGFVAQHPGLAKFAATFIGISLALATMFKAFSIILIPLKVVSGLIGGIARQVGGFRALGGILRGALLNPFTIWITLIGVLLSKMGLLDDALRIPLRFFKGMLEQILPPLRRLIASFRGLFDAIGEGKGIFVIFKPLVAVLIEIIGLFAEGFGRSIGKVIGGLIDILSGAIDVIVGLLSGDFRKAWNGLKRIVEGALRAVWGVIEFLLLGRIFGLVKAGLAGIVTLFGNLGRNALSVLRGGFSGVVSFFRNLPGRLWGFVKDIPTKLAEAFKDVGPKVLKAIVTGFAGAATNVAGVGRDIINGLIDLLNMALPNKIPVPGAPDIPLPDNPIPKLQKGGPVPGYGGGDRVHALLEPGEHVMTKEEVARAGGHGAIYALRRLLGGGGQARGRAFQVGGRVSGGAQLSAHISSNMEDFSREFRRAWQEIVTSTRRNSNSVALQFRQMRVGIERTMFRLSREVHERWERMTKFAIDKSNDMWRGVRANVMRLQTTVYRGMRYIGGATNEALKAFDAEPINLSIDAPGRATGGFIGKPGERGGDRELTLLGRGEAVLNHWQQRAINSLLPGQTTLADVMGRVRGYHAGGPAAPGYAAGRIVPVPAGMTLGTSEEVNSSILRLLKKLFAQFRFGITDAFDRDRSAGHRSPGHNVTGTAVDFVPGRGGSWDLIDRLASWAVRKGFTTYYDGRFGTTNLPPHGRGHHLHVEFGSSGATPAMFDVDDIKAPRVTGSGPLASLVRKMLSKVTKAANSYVNTMVPTGGDAYIDVDPEGPVPTVLRRVWEQMGLPFKALLSAIETGIVESGLRNLGFGDADSMGWRQERASLYPDPMNISHSAQRFYREWRQHHDPGETAGKVAADVQRPREDLRGRYHEEKGAALRVIREMGVSIPKNVQEMAWGGIVRGTSGSAVPILAHAGEWVLNPRQQSLVAEAVGTTIGRLKAFLGFTGGPTSFQGGGEVTRSRLRRIREGDYDAPMVDPSTFPGLDREIRRLNRALRNLRRNGEGWRKNLNKFISNIDAFTGEEGLLQQMNEHIDRIGAATERRVALARVGLRRVGRRLVGRAGGRASDAEMADMEIAGLREQRGVIRATRRESVSQLEDVEQQIARLRDNGVSRRERAQYEKLMAQRRSLNDAINEADIQLAENLQRRYELRREKFNAITAEQLKGGEDEAKLAEFWERLASVIGASGAVMNQAIGARVEAQRRNLEVLKVRAAQAREQGWTDIAEELEDQMRDLAISIQEGIAQQTQNLIDDVNQTAERTLRRVDRSRRVAGALGRTRDLPALFGEQLSALTSQRGGLSDLLERARREGNAGQVAELEEQIADLDAQIIEVTAERLTASIEAVNAAAERGERGRSLRERIAGVLGNRGALAQIMQERIDAAGQQIAALGELLAQAQAEGNEGAAQAIQDQIDDLNAQIIEGTAAQLQAAAEEIERQFQRGEMRRGLAERMLGIQERMGGRLGAAQGRLGLLQERGTAITGQIGALQALLADAIAQGNTAMAEQLQDQIDELTVQLAENEAAISDQTVAIRQVSIDMIQARQAFQGGVIGGLQGIINGIGTLTGQLDRSALVEQLRRLGDLLGQTGAGLREQLLAGFGIDLTGLSGMALVNAITGLNFDEIMEGMTDAQREQFQALINAILENEQAVISNTQQLNELNGLMNQPQGFSSSAWQWFREAIFTGMGDVLPQYQVPAMQSGGYITRGGMFNLHPGEFVVNAEGSNVPGGDVNIVVNEAGRPTDVNYLAARFAFEKKTATR